MNHPDEEDSQERPIEVEAPKYTIAGNADSASIERSLEDAAPERPTGV